MSDFVPRRVYPPYHFDIEHDPYGHWTARDRDGLAGGTFLTRKDAVRFALAETGGNRGRTLRVEVGDCTVTVKEAGGQSTTLLDSPGSRARPARTATNLQEAKR